MFCLCSTRPTGEKQLETLQSFEKIYAPFDGIVTVRNVDVGDLINSGSAPGTRTDLFHIAQPGKLRVYVYVPQEYSQAAVRLLCRGPFESAGARLHSPFAR